LFLQENRTLNFANRYYAEIIKLERTPPYKWKDDNIKKELAKDGIFWWLQNAAGKSILDVYGISDEPGKNHYNFIYKTYKRKAIYDMVKIAAELHLNYNAEKPTGEILKNLNSYKSLIDLCSGKPYVWNEDKQLLYSISTDRKDNGGTKRRPGKKIEETDVVLPVILYLK
ncbi:MAG: hypothetical protein GY757_02820, partial [bacterium]|nr:hypothetical protein [bacterium]